MRRVHIRFDVLEKNGHDYLTYGDELQNIINNVNKIKEDININWESPNKVTYNNKLGDFINVLQNDDELYKTYGKTILGINDDFKDKDKEYSRQFSNIEENEEYANGIE